MIDQLRRNPLIAGLAIVCAVLAGVIAAELIAGASSAPHGASRKPAPSEAKLLPPLAVAAPEQLYPETADRPLWIPTRRPAPPAAVASGSFARGQFILQGVTIAGETRIAMLKEKASGRVHRVEKGREVNGLQLIEVEPDRVTLAQGAEREVVDMRVQRPATPGAPPLAAAGPFGPVAGAPPAAAALGAPAPGIPPSPSPFGAPLVAPASPPGPRSPAELATPSSTPGATSAVNPTGQPVPQQASTTPMTPEELLARRRARRNQSPE